MVKESIGVAVIGAGMAGKAHAAGYRNAPTLYEDVLPPVRLVAIADAYSPLAEATALRFGYERFETSWQAIVDAKDIDVVSVVVANHLHREIVEALLASGKHVLCEKPLSDTLEDAQSMVNAASAASSIARIGLTFRRSPGIAYIRDLILSGRFGKPLNFSGTYWADYGCDPMGPISWRYKGPNGSGALADIGSHLSYLSEFVVGAQIETVSGGTLNTVITQRPKPLGAVVGHQGGAVSDEFESVENDDVATFSARYANGVTGNLQVSRVAAGHPNSLFFEIFCEKGAARFDFRNPGQVEIFTPEADGSASGYRTVVLGPSQPYWRNGLPMDAPGVGIGQNEGFVFQARAFLEEVAGVSEAESLPRNADFTDGLQNMLLLDAVAQSAAQGGATVKVNS